MEQVHCKLAPQAAQPGSHGNSHQHEWGYGKEHPLSPATWASVWPVAGAGERQSPINIVKARTRHDGRLNDPPLTVQYRPEEGVKLSNNGHTIKAECAQESTLSGGPLGDRVFRLAQFHLHWGAENNRGSEHRVDGTPSSAEIHFVHWNSSKYSRIEEAVDKSDGLAVLCVFVQVGSRHEGFEPISSQLFHVLYKNDGHKLSDVTFNPECLLPGNRVKFWTYQGSLTTPPCHESVQFIVLHENVEFSPDQMAALRSLHTGDKDSGHISDNFRPVCQQCDRVVQSSVIH